MPARPKTATLVMRMMLAQRTGRELAEEERPSGVEHVTETSCAIFAQSLAPALRGRAWVAFECDDGAAGDWSHFSMPHDAERYARCRRRCAAAIQELFRRAGLADETFAEATKRRGGRPGLPAPVFASDVRDERPRLGALEIYFVVAADASPGAELRTVLLHSKLNSSLWPNTRVVVRRLVNALGVLTYEPPRARPAPDGEIDDDDAPATPTSPPASPGGTPASPSRAFRRRAGAPSPKKRPHRAPLPRSHAGGGRRAKEPCEACGQCRYRERYTVVERFNKCEGGTHTACHAHGWPEASLKLARDAGHGLTRWTARKIGDCCALRCATPFCNHLYVREANHARSCLPSPCARARPLDELAAPSPRARRPASSPSDYMTSEYCLATRHTVQYGSHAPAKRVRVAVVVRFPQPFAPGPDLRDGSSALDGAPSLARSQGDDGGFLSLARSQGDDGFLSIQRSTSDAGFLSLPRSEAPAGDGDDERTRASAASQALLAAPDDASSKPPSLPPRSSFLPSPAQLAAARAAAARDDASAPRGDASAASAAAPAAAAARDDASVASGLAPSVAPSARTPERRPSWDASRSPPARRTRILSTRARVVVVVSPLGDPRTGERSRGHYEDGLEAGLGARWAEPRRGPKPAWEKSHGKGHAEPMRVDIAGPASQYGCLAARPPDRAHAKISRCRAWVPREWNEIRRPALPSYDCKAFGAPPDVEPAISFTAQPPAPGQHPSQFVGFLDVAAGGRTYEVSIRSTSGAASRSYTLVQPSTPLAFAATGPACLCVTLARSASLQRSNSNSSMGTVG